MKFLYEKTKMFKRLLIHTPEVIIIESMTKKTIFSKIFLEKENIVVRFSANPYLLEGYDIINSFEAGTEMLNNLQAITSMPPITYQTFRALVDGKYVYDSDCEALK